MIKITADNIITAFDYPDGTIQEQNQVIKDLIGNHCCSYECVHPVRLYRELGVINELKGIGKKVCMLVDEEGMWKDNIALNSIGSFLYQTDMHGSPIVGNILLAGEKWENGGISFCGIDEEVFKKLYPKLKTLTEKARKKR